MADNSTQEQWQQVAQEAQKDLAAATASLPPQKEQLSQINQQIAEQQIKLNDATTEEQRSELLRERWSLYGQKNAVTAGINNTNKQIEFSAERLRNANQQVELAADAPPGTRANPITQTTTPPINPSGTEDVVLPDVAYYEQEPVPIQEPALRVTSEGLPVFSEDGAVATGIKINPETGETYYTEDVGGSGLGGETSANQYIPDLFGTQAARSSGAEPDYVPFPTAPDYRVRISLSPTSDYFYNDPDVGPSDLLYPLKETRGVIFPYVPSITISYNANYSPTELVHTNYKSYNYVSSSIDSVNISADFTAQDVVEANYVLAVIHFFRSVTKMFYGQDNNPTRGVPPPLVYLSGHGEYAFDNHPLVITSFTLTYPQDVDYVNAGPQYNNNLSFNTTQSPNPAGSTTASRLRASNLRPGGLSPSPRFSLQNTNYDGITRVPTKQTIQLNAIPIVTRYDISNNFSLREYATGKLLRGSQRGGGGGIW